MIKIHWLCHVGLGAGELQVHGREVCSASAWLLGVIIMFYGELVCSQARACRYTKSSSASASFAATRRLDNQAASK